MADVLVIAGIAAGAYLAGSFPTAYLVTRLLRGSDIRTLGSRNPGAVNVFRQVGPGAAAVVLAGDALKGALVILVVRALGLGTAEMFAGALAAVIGHNWPVYLGFRGGKGVAVVFGLSLAVLPLWTLAAAGVAIVFGIAARSVVLGIASGIVAVNAFTIATGQSAACIALCLTLSAVVVATHYALAYPSVVLAVRRNGVRGLFEPD